CSGGYGTEVLNPPAPQQTPGKVQFIQESYEVVVTVPPGWAYTEYGPGTTPGPGVFKDIDPSTIALAYFTKGESRFKVFFSTLPTAPSFSEALENFVKARHPTSEVTVEAVPDETDTFFASVQENPFLDIFVSVKGSCLWMRLELVGTPEEQQQTLQEFGQI